MNTITYEARKRHAHQWLVDWAIITDKGVPVTYALLDDLAMCAKRANERAEDGTLHLWAITEHGHEKHVEYRRLMAIYDYAHREPIVAAVAKRRRFRVTKAAVALAVGAVTAYSLGGVFGPCLGTLLVLMCHHEMVRR